MKNSIVVLLAVFAGTVLADDFVEFRETGHNEYRYVDWSHSFSNKLLTDVTYVGGPGYNEMNACLGYFFSFGSLSVTPLLCGTMVKETSGVGIKLAAMVSCEKGRLKADAFYARLQGFKGVSSYDVLDTGNMVWSLGKQLSPKSHTRRWETGVSTGFFRQGGKWNPQYGPLLRRNDRLGSWGVSYRTGSANELRFIRTFTFTKTHAVTHE